MIELKINGHDLKEYGMRPVFGWFCNLIAPAPAKEYIKSKTRLRAGAKMFTPANRCLDDERQVTIPLGYQGRTYAQMYASLYNFVEMIKDNNGNCNLNTDYLPGVTFRMKYKNIAQMQESGGHLALFSLILDEPDPTDRAL